MPSNASTRTNHRQKAKVAPLTWGQFKQLVEAKGVTDNDQVYLIDVGPECPELFVRRESLASYMAPPDQKPQDLKTAKRKRDMSNLISVEIVDDETMLIIDQVDQKGKED